MKDFSSLSLWGMLILCCGAPCVVARRRLQRSFGQSGPPANGSPVIRFSLRTRARTASNKQQAASSKQQAAKSRLHAAGSKQQVAGSKQQAASNMKQAAGSSSRQQASPSRSNVEGHGSVVGHVLLQACETDNEYFRGEITRSARTKGATAEQANRRKGELPIT